jgi:murein tripeptide amidase MpaA
MTLIFRSALLLTTILGSAQAAETTPVKPVLFNTAFESGSIGLIEKLGDDEYRLHVRGQQDARGRNRQATWFYFRMDDVAGRNLTIRLAAFRGEYNERPSTPAGPWMRPVFSTDNENWTHFTEAGWDEEKAELTLKVRATANTLWIAHVPPYPHSRVLALLAEMKRSPHTSVEVIGETVLGRPLHLVTVTNFARPDAGKKVVWLQARQHAWECGTTFLVEGALRFATSNDPAAVKLRDTTIFKFVPMINVDSVVRGEVRFNANGFDPNRQWDEVDFKDKAWLERNPEIWYVKKALLAQHARQPIDIGLNLHNTETNEYIETMADSDPHQAAYHRLFERLVATTTFDPAAPGKLRFYVSSPTAPGNTTNSIWREARLPMALMEQRIGPSNKLGRIVTTAERLEFGRRLIQIMAEVVQ